ncbi:MAG: dTDP-glucose 4,6-dehydratase [Candidatus Omnitrophica bacterium]|nr:dTDP-glucose 4,6-dehydratase [Candidatus Omnitrophota bacterium]
MFRKYLITGAAGFIGSNFVHYLYRHHKDIEVTVLDKMGYSASPLNIKDFQQYPGFTFVQGDICDPVAVQTAMQGAQVVVNFAAETAVDRSIDNANSFLKTDIAGVHTLLQEARRQKQLQRFIQISTDEVYGHVLEGSFHETSELKPRNPYAASKLGGDRLAYSFFVTYGLPVIVTRASNNYGPRAYLEKVIPLFITNLIDGQQVPVYGEGKQIRDWLFVEDHCSAVDLLVDHGVNGEVYNIGGEQELTNMELTGRILRMMGKDKSAIKFVQDRPGHDFRYSLDCSKMRKLGWKQRYTVDEGLEQTIAWYRDNEHWWRPIKENMDNRYLAGFWGDKK